MVFPIVGCIDGHTDQAPTVSCGTGNQQPARSFGIAGFYAVCPLHLPQKLIMILQMTLSNAHITRAQGKKKNGIIHGKGRQPGQILGSGVMPRRVKPMWVNKVGVHQP